MLLRNTKIIYAFFFLASFLLLRVANVHMVFHSLADDYNFQDCEQCDFILTSNQVTALDTGNTGVDFIPDQQWEVILCEEFGHYNAPDQKILHTAYLFNKPPPFLL